MDNNTIYYVRARHKGAKFGLSEWGPTSHFKTKLGQDEPSAVISPASGTVDLLSHQTFSIAVFDAATATVQVPKIENGSVTGYVAASKHRELVNTEWQLSKTNDFAVIEQSGATLTGVVDWAVTGLLENTSYYLRVRQTIDYIQPESADAANVITYNTTRGVTGWSQSSIYATLTAFLPNVPYITVPTQGLSTLYKSLSLSASAFVTDGAAAHASTDWEVSTDSGFSTIVFSLYASTSSKTTASFSGLQANTTYYARVRYRDAVGQVSGYSPVVSFSTLTSFTPSQPTITNITNGVSKLGTSWFPVTSSAFSGKGTDTHASSTWQFSTTAAFDAGTITSSVTNSTTDKTTFTPVGLLNDVVYYARVMHRGADGLDSVWSPVVNFTITSNAIAYTTAGTYSYTIPDGITSADLDGQGTGGNGGGGQSRSRGGAGGASGQRLSTTISVVAGDVITTTIGARAARTVTSGGNGGDTIFKKNGVVVLTVPGGAGGTRTVAGVGVGNGVSGLTSTGYAGGNGGNSASGGVGGTGASSINTNGNDGTIGAGGQGGSYFRYGDSTYGGYGGYGKATITVS